MAQKKKAFAVLCDIFNWILLAAMLLCISSLLITKVSGGEPQFLGYRLFVIATGSMSPTLEVGDLILAENYEIGDELVKGDIITYEGSGDTEGYLVTHRLISVSDDEKGRILVLRGDYNDKEDTPVEENRVVAKYICKLRILGFIFKMMNSKFGMPLVILMILGFIIIETLDFQKNMKKNRQDEKQDNKDDK